jgi:hypothetical protein
MYFKTARCYFYITVVFGPYGYKIRTFIIIKIQYNTRVCVVYFMCIFDSQPVVKF